MFSLGLPNVEFAEGDKGTITIIIDGMCLRGAPSSSGKFPCIVSAYSSNERLVIGQVKTDEKSNEITASPRLLASLRLTGALRTLDGLPTVAMDLI